MKQKQRVKAKEEDTPDEEEGRGKLCWCGRRFIAVVLVKPPQLVVVVARSGIIGKRPW